MNQELAPLMRRSLVSGTIAGLGVMATAALAGRKETGSWAAPLNATSHILWGDKAASVNRVSPKYTLPGIVLTHASAVFRAALYEELFGNRQRRANMRVPVWEPLLGGASIAALAYANDYHLMPRRLTPGYEKRVSGRSLATIFGALALGLAARDMLLAATRSRRAG